MSGKNSEKLSEIDAHVTGRYDIMRRLGKGAYGIVWEAVDKKSKDIVAVKKIFDAFRNQTDAQRTFREIMFLLSFSNHENVIQLIRLHKANNDRDIYLVFEYMETDLHKVIKKGNILKDVHKIYIMYQLFKAMKYIHSGNVIHRDLKPSNILINAQCHCKIADFGLARSVSQRPNNGHDADGDPILTDYVATRWYRAPEILIASRKYTKGIDMWSLGCILAEMLLEKPLFPGSSTINQVERIMATLPPPTPQDIASVSAGYGSTLLEKAPNIPRRSLRELFVNIPDHALDLVSLLLVFNPNHRLTASEALQHIYVANFHHPVREPECGSNILPPLRDDVQLPVEEYRNMLYTMMDGNHRNSKNLLKCKLTNKTKSRTRRLTEHINKKETTNIQNSQSDTIKQRNLHFSSDDVRKEKEIHHYNKQPPQLNGKNLISQYAHNLINKNLRNFPPNHAKSCQCLVSHQRQPEDQQRRSQLNKTQRFIRSDPVKRSGIVNSNITTNQTKLRKGMKTTEVNNHTIDSTFNSIANNLNYCHFDHQQLPKICNPDILSVSSNKCFKDNITSLPNNITKHFAHSIDSRIAYDDPSFKNKVIQDYLNQMFPRPYHPTSLSTIDKLNKSIHKNPQNSDYEIPSNNNNRIRHTTNSSNCNKNLGNHLPHNRRINRVNYSNNRNLMDKSIASVNSKK